VVVVQRAHDWREDVIGSVGFILVAGLWLLLSPLLLEFEPGDPTWNFAICGFLVSLVALLRLTVMRRARSLDLAAMVIAGWLFATGFVLAESDPASWNSWVLGAIIFFLAVVSVTATATPATLPGREEGVSPGEAIAPQDEDAWRSDPRLREG
jgi:hypothetical protein